jgi:hypothetical protein
MLLFHQPVKNGHITARVRNYFESPAFIAAFGGITWPKECGFEFPFVKDMQFKRRDHLDGQIAVSTRSNELLTLHYHFYDNTFNIFVLLFPPGERIASQTKIVTLPAITQSR